MPEPQKPTSQPKAPMTAQEQKTERDAEIAAFRKIPCLDLLMGEEAERMEAESYLASGGKLRTDGFDLSDPKVRAERMDCPKEAFVDFEVNPLPKEIAQMVEELPEDWDGRFSTLVDRICETAERILKVHPWMYVTLQGRRVLVCRIPGQ